MARDTVELAGVEVGPDQVDGRHAVEVGSQVVQVADGHLGRAGDGEAAGDIGDW